MPFAQDLIHKFEQGVGMRYLRIGLAVLGVVVFTGAYNWRAFKNLSSPEAMDAAQLARNLSEGKGYTTLYVRPISMYLIRRVNEKTGRVTAVDGVPDYARIRTMHPDVSNPPVYPVMLAGLLKILPLPYTVSQSAPFRYPPELAILLFNQLLFLGLVVALFFLTKQLFDPTVAWLSSIVLFGTELFWRFAGSGLSTTLLMLIFVALLWGLFLLEREAREPTRGQGVQFGLAALCGVVVGIGCLTRYAFGWIIVPLVLYLAIFAGPRRMALAMVALAAFTVVIAPWVTRNVWLTGLPFGTATYAVVDGTFIWPGNRLGRSLVPHFEVPVGISPLSPLWNKLFANLKVLFATDVPRFTGSWAAAFFLAGLVMNFHNLGIRRLRYFLLFCLPVLGVVQAMGRTHLSEDTPELNTENLLVLLAPIIIVYGVSFFLVLLDQLELPLAFLRYVIMGVFAVLVSVPLILVFFPPPPLKVAYPPYLTPRIQQVASWMKPDELMMSDVPWAVAWYGNRQAVWLTRHLKPPPEEASSPDTFFAINDLQKPILGIYLTQQIMDGRFLSDWVKAGERSWGNFLIDTMVQRNVPPWFPLRAAPAPSGFLPDQLFLADWERWRLSPQPAPTGDDATASPPAASPPATPAPAP